MGFDSTALLADRTRKIPMSAIRKVFDQARAMEKAGEDVVRMEIGRPDFDTPEHIKAAAQDALARGEVHYAPNRGIEELRIAIADKLARDNGIHVTPDGIVVTVGCKEAILLTFMAYLESGDEVLVPNPAWDSYRRIVEFLGGRPVSYPLRPENGYEPDPEDLEARVTPRTKFIVLITPHNPTGSVCSVETLRAIAALAMRHNLLVVSDEIYEKLVYDGIVHHSIAAIPGMAERTITINGFSKAYAMDGWRIGYAAGPDALIQPLVKVHQYTTNSVATFAQWGAVAAYNGPQEPVERMRQEFDRRRRLVVASLRSMPGVSAVEPKGAFYIFPDFSAWGMNSMELAELLLREARIACVPGDAFGDGGAGHLRLAYSTAYDSIARGMERLRALAERLAKGHVAP